jgi:hypothetical protein
MAMCLWRFVGVDVIDRTNNTSALLLYGTVMTTTTGSVPVLGTVPWPTSEPAHAYNFSNDVTTVVPRYCDACALPRGLSKVVYWYSTDA